MKARQERSKILQFEAWWSVWYQVRQLITYYIKGRRLTENIPFLRKKYLFYEKKLFYGKNIWFTEKHVLWSSTLALRDATASQWIGAVRGREVWGKGVYISTFGRDKSTKWATDDGKHHFLFPLNNANNQTLKVQQKKIGWKSKKSQGFPLICFTIFWPRIFFNGIFIFLMVKSDWGKLKMIKTDVCCSNCRAWTDRERR